MSRRVVLALCAGLAQTGAALAAPCVSESFDQPMPGASNVVTRRADVPSSQFPGLWQEGVFGGYFYALYGNGEGALQSAAVSPEWAITFLCDETTKTCEQAQDGSEPPAEAAALVDQLKRCFIAPETAGDAFAPPVANVPAAAPAAEDAKAKPVAEYVPVLADARDPDAMSAVEQAKAQAAKAKLEEAKAQAEKAKKEEAQAAKAKLEEAKAQAEKAKKEEAEAQAAKAKLAEAKAQAEKAKKEEAEAQAAKAKVEATNAQAAKAKLEEAKVPAAKSAPVAAAAPAAKAATPVQNTLTLEVVPSAVAPSAVRTAPAAPVASAPETAPAVVAAPTAQTIRIITTAPVATQAAPAAKRATTPGVTSVGTPITTIVCAPPPSCGLATLPEGTQGATLQRLVVLAGADPGPIDGFPGKRTEAGLIELLGDAGRNLPVAEAIIALDRLICARKLQ